GPEPRAARYDACGSEHPSLDAETPRRLCGVSVEWTGYLATLPSPPLGVWASSRLSDSLLPRCLVPLSHLRPVDHVPPRRHVIRPAVLVLEVVGVLPHIEAEHRNLAVH